LNIPAHPKSLPSRKNAAQEHSPSSTMPSY
jgi:hypothetical protein